MTGIGKLDGGVAIVTGGGGAIGGASSRLLASEGAAVLVADANLAGAQAVASDIAAAGGTAKPFQLDVSDPAQAEAAVAAAVDAFGGLSVLVNVAAAVTPDAPVDKLPLEEWSQALRST